MTLLENPEFRRPSWREGAVWMGCRFGGLARVLLRNRARVRPAYWPECLIDLLFAAGNSALGGLESLLFASAIRRVPLPTDPIFIVGHWRTGTTLLHELLRCDERHRCPTTYECFLPNHFLLTQRWLKSWTGFLLPHQRPPDRMAMGWDKPQEDEFALCNLGVPSPYWTIAFPNEPPQDADYLTLDELSEAERRRWSAALCRFVRKLLYCRPGRLVLKSPTHSFRLPHLLELFPDARFVYLVRHPVAVYASTRRLWQSLYISHGYQDPDFDGLEEYVLASFAALHERMEATRSQVPPQRFRVVRYEDLVADPCAELRQLYDQLELGDFESVSPAVHRYVAELHDYRTNSYEVSAADREAVAERWKDFIEQYGYDVCRV